MTKLASGSSRRIAFAIAALSLIAAPATAQMHEVGSWMPSPADGRRSASPLADLPAGPRVLQQKPLVDMLGVGERFAGKSHVAGTTHKLRAGDAAKSGDVLIHRWQRNGVGRP